MIIPLNHIKLVAKLTWQGDIQKLHDIHQPPGQKEASKIYGDVQEPRGQSRDATSVAFADATVVVGKNTRR